MTGFYAEQKYKGSSPREVECSLAQRVTELEAQLSQIMQVVDKHLCLKCGSQLDDKNEEKNNAPDPQGGGGVNSRAGDINGSKRDLVTETDERLTLKSPFSETVSAQGDCTASQQVSFKEATAAADEVRGHERKAAGNTSFQFSAPTGFGAYKQLFDCIDYRYLPPGESASLSCELLHHMLCNNSAAKLRMERSFESARQLELPGSVGVSLSRLDQVLYNMGLVETRIQKEVIWEMNKELGLQDKSRILLPDLIESLMLYEFKPQGRPVEIFA